MRFYDNLYTVVSSLHEDQKASFQIRLNASHTIFAAHFPGEPILPGACIVQIIAELVTRWQGDTEETLPVVKMSNLKFLTIISPEQTTDLEVILEIKAHNNEEMRVAASVRKDSLEYAKMTSTFAYGA